MEIFFGIYIIIVLGELPIYTNNNEKSSSTIFYTSVILIGIIYLTLGFINEYSFFRKKNKLLKNEKLTKIIFMINRKKIYVYVINIILVFVCYVSLTSSYLSFCNNTMISDFNTVGKILASDIKDYPMYIARNPNQNYSQMLNEVKAITVLAIILIYVGTRILLHPTIKIVRNKMRRYNAKVHINGDCIENLKFINSDNDNYIFEKTIGWEYVVIPKSSVKYIEIEKHKKVL